MLKPFVDPLKGVPLSSVVEDCPTALARGCVVYNVMRAHVLSGSRAQRVHLIDHAILFGDKRLFNDHVIKHFHAYARYKGCDCGAAVGFSPKSFDHMVTPLNFLAKCVCTHNYAHLTSIVSPDFFGTRISERSRLLTRDDGSSASSSSSEMDVNDVGITDVESNPESTYLRWPSPAQACEDRVSQLILAPTPSSPINLETWLREADYFRRISSDAHMLDLIERLISTSIDLDNVEFLKLLCESGRLFAELAVQLFTRLTGDDVKNSLLLRNAHTRVAKYIVTIWHPDKKHDFVYRATVREAIALDNVAAFKILAPSLFHMHQRQYRAPKYLLSDLVHKKCWNILNSIVEGDLLGRQLRKAKVAEVSARSPSGFAQYWPIVDPSLCLHAFQPSTTSKLLRDVTNTMDYSVLLNEWRINYNGQLSAPIFEYFRAYLPAPEWLSERDGHGYGSLLAKYWASLSPNAIRYVLLEVQPGSANWRDGVKRSLSDNIRWGKHGREKLLLLCEQGIDLSVEAFDAILTQREYWKLSEADLEQVRSRVVE